VGGSLVPGCRQTLAGWSAGQHPPTHPLPNPGGAAPAPLGVRAGGCRVRGAEHLCVRRRVPARSPQPPAPPNQPYFVLAVREPVVTDLDGQVGGEQAVPQGQVAAKQTPAPSPPPRRAGQHPPTHRPGPRGCAQGPTPGSGVAGRLALGAGWRARHARCRTPGVPITSRQMHSRNACAAPAAPLSVCPSVPR